MANHQQVLKGIYPSPERLRALLPTGDARCRTDLSSYGLQCLGFIGSGLMATVYRVRKGNKEYACKVTSLRYTNPGAPAASDIALRTLQEIKLTQTLMRDNVHGIMPLTEYLPSESKIREYINKANRIPKALIPPDWMILELMPLGLPYTEFMNNLFRSGKRLTESQWAALMLDLIQPVQYMHKRSGIIHRDLKPGNIMLIIHENGQVRAAVADFNVSKAFAGKRDYDYTKVGSDKYAHPRIMQHETRLGVRKCDAENADIYAIGQIGYQLLNAGATAPCRGYIPAPKNPPSARVTELLRSMLSDDLQKIPNCDSIVNTLRNMISGNCSVKPPYDYSVPKHAQQGYSKPRHQGHKYNTPKPNGKKKRSHSHNQYGTPMFGQKISMTDIFDEPFFSFPKIKF